MHLSARPQYTRRFRAVEGLEAALSILIVIVSFMVAPCWPVMQGLVLLRRRKQLPVLLGHVEATEASIVFRWRKCLLASARSSRYVADCGSFVGGPVPNWLATIE